jgi:putative transposase
VKELADDGIPVAVTCRVLKLARQPYYRWLANPVTDAEYLEAHRANALFDAHRDDPEFGYRFLVAEAGDAGQPMAERTRLADLLEQRLVECLRQEAGQERQGRPARA